jgi:hypothetical protein
MTQSSKRAKAAVRPADVFVGRVESASAFELALRRHAGELDASGIGDAGGRNRFVVHAIPGSGKTTFLAQLRRWATGAAVPDGWPTPPYKGQPVTTAWFDVSTTMDVDQVLLTIRAQAAKRKIATPAFDVGYVERWSQTRPMEVSPSELEPSPRILGRNALPAIEAGAKSALIDAGLPAGAGWVSKLLVGKAATQAERFYRARLAERFPPLAAVIEQIIGAPSDVHAAALVRLLDWDLGNAPPDKRTRWIVFVDSFDPDRRVADLLDRLVAGGSFAFWVVGSRKPLRRLGEDAVHHELPPLSAGEQERFLDQALGAMPTVLSKPEARRAVIAASKGLPLYLRLAVEEARRKARRGLVTTEEYFTVDLELLVERLLGDLPYDERRAVNAAALASAFDPPLISAAVGVDEAAVERLLRRGFATRIEGGSLSFSLHPVVRDTAFGASIESHGGLNDTDWDRLAERLLSDLGRRYAWLGRIEDQLEYLGAAFDIATARRRTPRWLLDEALRPAERPQVVNLLSGRTPEDRRGTWTHALDRFFACWVPDDEQDFADRLEAFVANGAAPDDVRRTALRFQAFRLRTRGVHGAAEGIFSRLRAEPDGDDDRLRFQHALSLIHVGWFGYADALRLLLELTGADPADAGSRADRLTGEIRLQHGDVASAAAASERRANYLEATGNTGNAVEARVAEARHRSLLEPAALGHVEQVIELTRSKHMGRLTRAALCSSAICRAGDSDGVLRVVEEAQRTGQASGEPAVTIHELLAWSFDAAVRGDRARAAELRALPEYPALLSDTRWSRPIQWWLADVLEEPPPRFEGAQWLESEAVVRDRWLALLSSRRGS